MYDNISYIFTSLDSQHGLAAAAAQQCLEQLGQMLGPNILRGRVEMYNTGTVTNSRLEGSLIETKHLLRCLVSECDVPNLFWFADCTAVLY